MPLDMDGIARVVAQLVKQEVGKLGRDDGDLRAENKALAQQVETQSKQIADLTDQLAAKASVDALAQTSEDLRTILSANAKALGEHKGRLDDLDKSFNEQDGAVAERLDGQDEAIKAVRDHAEETRTMSKEAHESHKAGIKNDFASITSKVNGIAADVKSVDEQYGNIQQANEALSDSLKDVEQKLEDGATHMEDVSKKLDDLANVDIAKQVSDACNTVFDENWQHKFRSMIPEGPDQDAIVKEVFENAKAFFIENVAMYQGEKGADAEFDFDWAMGAIKDVVVQNKDLLKGEKGDPGEAVMPSPLQILEGIKTQWSDVRALAVKDLPKMEHRGVYDPETQYDVGDEVIKGGSTYRMVTKTDEQPGHDAEGWQMISQGRKGSKGLPGNDGERGEKGDQGPAGVGIDDMLFTEGMFVISLTNGVTKEFDLTEFMELLIKAIGER